MQSVALLHSAWPGCSRTECCARLGPIMCTSQKPDACATEATGGGSDRRGGQLVARARPGSSWVKVGIQVPGPNCVNRGT